MKAKNVRFDYFQFYELVLDRDKNMTTGVLFDLEPILLNVSLKSVPEREQRQYDDAVRLQIVVKAEARDAAHKQRPYWELEFVRVRKNDRPGIATDNGDFSPLNLMPNESVGESASVLYDPSISLFMMQRNKNSVSPSQIEEYFSCDLIAGTKKNLQLRPVVLPQDIEKFNNKSDYQNMVVSFSDVKLISAGKIPLSKIIDGIEEYKGAAAEIVMKAGKVDKKTGTLEPQSMSETLKALVGNHEVKKLQVKWRPDNDTPFELCDLVQSRVNDKVAFSVSRDRLMMHPTVFAKMVEKYAARELILKKALRKLE